MSATLGAQLFWFFAIGLTAGYTGYFVYKERDVGLLPSMALSTLGSLVTGNVALLLGLPGSAAYAVIGAVGFLFVANSFRQKEEPIFIDTSRG